MRKTYVVIHADTGPNIKAWLPDFPGFSVAGDRWTDTLTMVPLLLERHVEGMARRGEPLPEPTTPDLWVVHAEYPEALIGFVEVETGEG